ncbi:MAG: hypothetical protein ACLGI5_10790 [Thermoleophilia bacterium]
MRSDDPSLSPKANDLLTKQLQEAVGAEEVVVPEDVPDRARERHATRSPVTAMLTANRPVLIVTFLTALVVGGVVALTTGQYWALVLAAALHAGGTLAVAAGSIALSTKTEHVDPTVAARLEEEGVADPDAVLSDLVEDFAGMRDARGVPEVVSTGHNERTASVEQDRARATAEQRSALTPTSDEAPAGGSGSVIEALEWWVVGAASALTVAIAVIIGGEMWALPAIVLPLGAGWIGLQYWMARGRATSERPTGDEAAGARRLAPIATFVVVGVIWFMVVLGWIGGLL